MKSQKNLEYGNLFLRWNESWGLASSISGSGETPAIQFDKVHVPWAAPNDRTC